MSTSPTRLDAIVAAIPSTARAMADIGYDLGRIAVAALTARPGLSVVGVEIQPASAARVAARMVAEAVPEPVRARFSPRTGDGLAPLARGEVDGALMAGLGEGTMLEILDRSPAVASDLDWLVLCPSHLESRLRPGLAARGLWPRRVTLVEERGRFYEVLFVTPGPAPDTGASPARQAFGADLFDHTPPDLALAFLRDLETRFAGAIAAGLRSYDREPDKAPLAAKLRALPAARAEIEARVRAAR